MKRIRLDDFEPGTAEIAPVLVNGERKVSVRFGERVTIVMTREQALAWSAAVREAAG